MDSGADDYEQINDGFRILTSRESLGTVRTALSENNLNIQNFGLEYIPLNEVEITDFEQALKVVKILEDLG